MDAIVLRVLKGGFKSSEFWLAVLSIALPYLADFGSDKVAAWTTAHGWAGGLVAAVYIAARGYVKGQAAASLTPTTPGASGT